MSFARRMIGAAWFPYLAPFALFMLLTYAASLWPESAHLWYAAKTLLVGGLLIALRRRYTGFAWRAGAVDWVIAVAAGLLVLVIWVAPEGLHPWLRIGRSEGFNPYDFGVSGSAVWGVIAFRLLGASVVVPVMEELFWRSLVMRYLISADFERVPLGAFRLVPFAVVALAFGFEHDRWLVGIVAGLIYGGLLVWRKNLFACMVAHGVTNLGLGIYVLRTGEWSFW